MTFHFKYGTFKLILNPNCCTKKINQVIFKPKIRRLSNTLPTLFSMVLQHYPITITLEINAYNKSMN